MARILLGNIKGHKGDPGPKGDTPVKGVDYLTPEEIEQIKNEIMKDIPEPAAPFATESADHPGCYYRMVGEEKEWINPPMVVGTEYRTNERHMGKPVYTTLVNYGAMPDGTHQKNESIEHGLSVVTPIRCYGNFGSYNLPCTVGGLEADVAFDATRIYVFCNGNQSSHTAHVQLWYTKT